MSTNEAGGKGWNFVHNYPDFGAHKGDVCNYIDGNWRMPNANEFGSATDYTLVSGTLPDANVDDYGTSIITTGRNYMSAYGSIFFPLNGDRYTFLADRGSYMSGTPKRVAGKTLSYVYALSFSPGGGTENVYPEVTCENVDFTSIRCIRKLPTD
jgi:hypothetical protein